MTNGMRKGAASEFTESQLGGLCYEIENPVVTGAAIVQAVQGNGDRVGLVFMNLGANPVYVSFNPAPGVGNGILLAANGGNATMNCRDDYTLPTRPWNCVSPAGASLLYTIQIVRLTAAPKGATP